MWHVANVSVLQGWRAYAVLDKGTLSVAKR